MPPGGEPDCRHGRPADREPVTVDVTAEDPDQ